MLPSLCRATDGISFLDYLWILAELLCVGACSPVLGCERLEALLIRDYHSYQKVFIAVAIDPDLLHQLTFAA